MFVTFFFLARVFFFPRFFLFGKTFHIQFSKISFLFSSFLRAFFISQNQTDYFFSSFLAQVLFFVSFLLLLRKEVIHPHVPVGIPCYDFTPIISPTLDSSFLAVRPPASGVTDSHGVTGGVYKARERIHRDMLIRDY